MRFILNYSVALSLISSVVACGGGHYDKHDGHNKEHIESVQANDDCTLYYNSDSAKLTWTAYKTTEKVGVGGTFGDFKMGGVKEGRSAAEVFENVKFSIKSASINSNNPDRDKKISEYFFNSMVQGVELNGTVGEIGDNEASVYLDMNGLVRKQIFDLNTDNRTYCTISADLNLEKWNALESVNALNKVCFDLHKGADGESKLWSEVHVELTVKLNLVCP